MNNLYDILGIPFGFVMRLIYRVCGSYTLSILLFVLFVKLLLFPITKRVYIESRRLQLIQPKLRELNETYQNDQMQLMQKRAELFAEERVSNGFSMLLSFLQVFVMFGVVDVIYKPITHILHISRPVRASAVEIVSGLLTEGTISIRNLTCELMTMDKVQVFPDAFAALPENFLVLVQHLNQNFTLFGMPLSVIPTKIQDFSASGSLPVWLLPFVLCLFSLVTGIISAKRDGRRVDIMVILGSLLTFCMALLLPAGISFYWLCSSVASFLITRGLQVYYTQDRLRQVHEKLKAASKAKYQA